MCSMDLDEERLYCQGHQTVHRISKGFHMLNDKNQVFIAYEIIVNLQSYKVSY